MWHVLKVAYFEQSKVRLVLGPIREALECIRRELGKTRVVIQPHWKFGPHINFMVECDDRQFDQIVLPICQRIITPWLQDHPSNTTLEADSYEALSRKIAITELEKPPFLPLLENNSISQHPFIGSDVLLAPMVESRQTFLSDSLDLTLKLLQLLQEKRESGFLALAVMMAITGEQYRNGGFSRGFNSYRSHAEYFFAAYDTNDKLRQQFDRLDSRLANAIDQSIRAAMNGDWTATSEVTELIELIGQWRDIIQRTGTRNLALVTAHHAELLEKDVLMERAEALRDVLGDDFERSGFGDRQPSVMSQRMEHEIGRKMLSSPEFMAHRTTVNFFYMILPLLEISPSQKFCLCHLVARSAERIYGVTWRDLMYDSKELSGNQDDSAN